MINYYVLYSTGKLEQLSEKEFEASKNDPFIVSWTIEDEDGYDTSHMTLE